MLERGQIIVRYGNKIVLNTKKFVKTKYINFGLGSEFVSMGDYFLTRSQPLLLAHLTLKMTLHSFETSVTKLPYDTVSHNRRHGSSANPLPEPQILQLHFMFLSFYKKSEPKIAIILCTPVCLGHNTLRIIDINFICRVTTSVHQQTFIKLYLKIRSCQEKREKSRGIRD